MTTYKTEHDALRAAIIDYKESYDDYSNAFSANIFDDDDEYYAECSFSEDSNLLVVHSESSQSSDVAALWNLDDDVISDIAHIICESQNEQAEIEGK